MSNFLDCSDNNIQALSCLTNEDIMSTLRINLRYIATQKSYDDNRKAKANHHRRVIMDVHPKRCISIKPLVVHQHTTRIILATTVSSMTIHL